MRLTQLLWPAALLVLLSGCAGPTLRYQPMDGDTQTYHARVVLDIAMDAYGLDRSESISFTTQLQATKNSESRDPSVKVQFDHLVVNSDFESMDFSSFETLNSDQQALVDFMQQGFVLTQKGSHGYEVTSEGNLPRPIEESGIVLDPLNRMQFEDVIALLPPQLPFELGAKLQVKQAGFILDYEVAAVNEKSVQLVFQGQANQAMLDQQTPLKEKDAAELQTKDAGIVGWVIYERQTGKLEDGRALFKLEFADEALKGHVEVLIAIHQDIDDLPEVETYFPDDNDNRRHRISSDQWPLTELMKARYGNDETQAPELRASLETSTDSRDHNPSLLLKVYDANAYAWSRFLSSDIQDEQGQSLPRQSIVSMMEDGPYERDEQGRYRQYALYPHQAFKKGAVNLEIASYQQHTFEPILLNIDAGKGHYQGAGFRIDAQQIDAQTWRLTLTQPRWPRQSTTPDYTFGLNMDAADIDSVRFIFPAGGAQFALPSTSERRLFQLNMDVKQQFEVRFVKAPSHQIPMLLLKSTPQILQRTLLTDATIASQAALEPSTRYQPKTKSYAPRFEFKENEAFILVPEPIAEQCQIADFAMAGHNELALNWKRSGVDYSKDYRNIRYTLTSRQGQKFFYDISGQAAISCPAYQKIALKKGQDYTQSQPWLITLTGELASLSPEQMRKELQALNEKGEPLMWMDPVDDADFAYPTLKAWGKIAKIERIRLLSEPEKVTGTVQFGPKP
ncbi:hypothetical protein VST7929_02778 [Vibrio stylophorae]|uniref:Lipoprotein n=1 Tax=Vibrio stylophorae TaxID=659351 RepID=A0ABN8DUY4_9VIBR|nr:hypothetical protein [Vibrio stylophorae]CAH0535117.1 hypothetical protein VST7929_02778 [Vibrio stylophorae]